MRSEMYTATQGLIARQLQLDAVANNIANASTTGYRETSPFFRSFNAALEDDGPVNVLNNAANNQPVAAGVFMHDKQGGLKATDNPFDMAIVGDGFFKVDTPNGVRYTRNGHFKLNPINDETGRLITAEGWEVLGTNGNPIQVNLRPDSTYITHEGRVIQDGAELGQIAVVTFADKTTLMPEENTSIFNQDPNAPEIAAQNAMVRSGFLETSNVNIAKQMIDMITAHRAYEANARTIKTIDTGMNQTVINGFGVR